MHFQRVWLLGRATHGHAARCYADHTFFFEGMKAGGGGEPGAKLTDAIRASFGSFEEFSKQFKAAGATQFGSGWAWLVTDKGGMLTGKYSRSGLVYANSCLCGYFTGCLLYTSPSPRDRQKSRMPSSA